MSGKVDKLALRRLDFPLSPSLLEHFRQKVAQTNALDLSFPNMLLIFENISKKLKNADFDRKSILADNLCKTIFHIPKTCANDRS